MRARVFVSVGSCLGLLLVACVEPRLGKVVPVLAPTSPPPPSVHRVGTFDLVVRTDVAIDDTLPPEPGSDACVALRVTDGTGAAIAAPSELCGAMHPGPRGNGDLALSLPCNPDAPAHQIQLWLRTLAYPAGHPILPAEIARANATWLIASCRDEGTTPGGVERLRVRRAGPRRD